GLLPRLDLVGGYGVNGLSGPGRNASATFISAVDVSKVDSSSKCTPLGPEVFECTRLFPPSPLSGDQRDAYGTRGSQRGLLAGDYDTYSFGLRLTVPIDNASARATHQRSQIELDQAQLNHRELLSQVTLEVRQTVSDVVASRQRIDTARVASHLAEENLRN